MTMHLAVAGWLLGQPSGANRRLLALLAHAAPLLADGEQITVLHRPGVQGPPLPRVRWMAVDIPAAPAWRRWLGETARLGRRLRQLGATGLDHGFLPLPRLPLPTLLVVHDLRAVDGLTRWPRWLARAVLRDACTRATLVVAPSQWTADRLRAFAPRARLEVVQNGVDRPAGPPPPSPLPVPAHGYLLHVGHLEPRKNLAVVVDALATLPATARPELWLAGRDAGALAALRTRQRDVVVRALGQVDDQQLHGLYGHARAVVMPSRHEGFGLPALEGLAHGTPVLASAAGALPEVVGPHGVLLPPDAVAAWAAAIAAPPPAPDEAAKERHLGAFAWPTAAAKWLALWRQLHA